ncbi:MAG: pyridoxamine 5'-phosphate oxidase family protein [Acidimicrobiaceae bacterium]|nr:pyridoxamine 5'-phosphate oxidase family protein [Acidimicrobiaceae bacterium]
MSDVEVAAFLADGRRAQVATVDAAGLVDLVPMSYLLWDGSLALWTDPASKKVRNLRANPSITCLVEAGEAFEEFRAVQLRGRGELLEDLPSSRRAGELLFGRYQPGGLSDETRNAAASLAPQRVVIVVHAERVLSWDHRKLAGMSAADIGH